MVSLFHRSRADAARGLRTLDVGVRSITLRASCAAEARARVRRALGAWHPHRAAASALVAETAARALGEPDACDGSPLCLALTVTETAVRVEARAVGIVEAACAVRSTAGRLATRSGIRPTPAGPAAWWAFGEPLVGEAEATF